MGLQSNTVNHANPGDDFPRGIVLAIVTGLGLILAPALMASIRETSE